MENALLGLALQNNDLDLKGTAEKMYGAFANMKASTRIETEKKLAENRNTPTRKAGKVGGTMSPPKGFDPAKASQREIDERALEMLG